MKQEIFKKSQFRKPGSRNSAGFARRTAGSRRIFTTRKIGLFAAIGVLVFASFGANDAFATQFLVPDEDVTTGGWTIVPLWEKLDEQPPDDDTTSIERLNPGSGTFLSRVGLAGVTDPQTNVDHVIRIRLRKSAASGKAVTLTTVVLEEVDVGTIQTFSTSDALTEIWQTFSFTLSAATADAIQNYANLRVYINVTWGSGGAGRDAYATAIWMEVPDAAPSGATVTASSTGTQTSSIDASTTAQYLGGAFTFVATTTNATATQIIVSDTGTVTSTTFLSNLRLRYEVAASCSYGGSETIFGTASTFSSEKATVTGSLPISTSTQTCVYAEVDVSSSTPDGKTIELEITSLSDVTLSSGSTTGTAPVAISGATTLNDNITPTPDPANFSSAPNDTGTSTIAMTATTGFDATGFNYIFAFTPCTSNGGTGGTSSTQSSASYTDTGLQANQCYAYTITLQDTASPVNTGTASASSSAYTAAAIPGAPTLSNETTSTLDFSNNANGNPASSPVTEFAIFVSSTSPTDSNWDGKWVNTDGTATTTVVWMSDAAADALTGASAIKNLNSGTTYNFKVKARNFSSEETALSSVGSGTTVAVDNVPPTPASSTWASIPSALSTTSLSMRITTSTDASSSPVSYLFTYSSSCAVDNGTNGASSSWQSNSAYTNTGLNVNKCYSYTAKARDSAGTPNETTSTATSSAYTFANKPDAPTLSSPTTSTLLLTNNQNSNPSNTRYAVQVTSTSPSDTNWNGFWLTSVGATSSGAVWITNLTTLTVGSTTYPLKSNNTYTFTVKAQNGDSLETSQGATGNNKTLPNIPGTPSYASVSSSTLTVNWSAHAEGADTYKVERATSSQSYVQVASGVAGTSYNATATPNTTWYFRVRGTNSSGDGPYSASSSQLMYPAAPSTPTYTNVTTSTLTVNWTAPSGGADSYKVERATSSQVYAQIAGGVTNTSTSDTGLASSTTYFYRVRATNGIGDGGYSASSSVITNGEVQDTEPPTPASSTWASIPAALSTTSISMRITTSTDASSSPVSYLFTYSSSCSVDNGTGGTSSTWQSDSAYTDTILDINKCYSYTAKARDSAGTPNQTTSTATSSAYTYAATPSAPTLGSPTTSTLAITNNQNGNPSNTTFAVQVTSTSPTDSNWDGKWVDSTGAATSTVVWMSDATLDTIVVKNLAANNQYTFTVKAKNGDSIETSQGATGSGTTVPNIPGTPTYASVSSSTLTVNWTAPTGGATTYKVERATSSESYTQIASGVAGTSYNATATPNTTWYF